MDWSKNDSFLFNMAFNRFRQIVKEFAIQEGMDGQFIEQVLDRYLTNPGALGDILAEYSDQQAELRLSCLLRAAKEVHRELARHFEANHKGNRKALIHEMPTDKYLSLKLQSEFILRYARGIVEEELSKLKEAGGLRDKLLEAIADVDRVKSDREELSQQIREEAKLEVASQFVEINQLHYEVESQQNEIKRIGDQIKAIKLSAGSQKEMQSLRDSIQSDHQYRVNMLTNLDKEISSKVSRQEIEGLRTNQAKQQDDFDELKRNQNTFGYQLKEIENRVIEIAGTIGTARTETEKIAQAVLEESKNALEKSVQAQLNGSIKNCEQLKREMKDCFGTLVSTDDLKDITVFLNQTEEQQKQLQQDVEMLKSQANISGSETELMDKIEDLLKEKLHNLEEQARNQEIPSEQVHLLQESLITLQADVQKLSEQNGHALTAHERIEELLKTLASLEEKFPGLEQKIASLLPEDLAKVMAGEWEKIQAERLEKWLVSSVKQIRKAEATIADARSVKWGKERTLESLRNNIDEKTKQPYSQDFIELVELLWSKPSILDKLRKR
jgi:DNA repair exonuclease SbcCD ATPase subunit